MADTSRPQQPAEAVLATNLTLEAERPTLTTLPVEIIGHILDWVRVGLLEVWRDQGRDFAERSELMRTTQSLRHVYRELYIKNPGPTSPTSTFAACNGFYTNREVFRLSAPSRRTQTLRAVLWRLTFFIEALRDAYWERAPTVPRA
jgi:hypothetical protein